MSWTMTTDIPRTNFQAIFGVHQNTPRMDEQIEFYKSVGAVVDDEYQLKGGAELPDAWFKARGIDRKDLEKFVAMKLPDDPYMHVYFYSWKNLSTKEQWPPVFNQIGSRSLTFLVDDVDYELKRLTKDFPETPILSDTMAIERKWGTTTSALVKDPEGNFLELVSVAGGRFDEKKMKAAPFESKSWLHFHMNCEKWSKTRRFYRAFGKSPPPSSYVILIQEFFSNSGSGMAHDYGTDFRGDVIGFPLGVDVYLKQMKEGLNFNVELDTRNDFLRNARDVSGMHLELLEGIPGREKKPGEIPTWSQLGIMRYCWKVPDYYAAVKDIKRLGKKIYVEDQRACLVWGDTQWIFYGDCDGNILTQEQWYPQRRWQHLD